MMMMMMMMMMVMVRERDKALSDAPARSNSDMQRNNEARTTVQANAKPRHLTPSDVGEQTQNVSEKHSRATCH